MRIAPSKMTVVALQSSALEMRSWGLGRWGAPTRLTPSLGGCSICGMGIGRRWSLVPLCLCRSWFILFLCPSPSRMREAMPGWGQPVRRAGVSWAHGTRKGTRNPCSSVNFRRNLVFSWIALLFYSSSLQEYLRLLTTNKVGPENFSSLINSSFLSTNCQFLFYQCS